MKRSELLKKLGGGKETISLPKKFFRLRTTIDNRAYIEYLDSRKIRDIFSVYGEIFIVVHDEGKGFSVTETKTGYGIGSFFAQEDIHTAKKEALREIYKRGEKSIKDKIKECSLEKTLSRILGGN